MELENAFKIAIIELSNKMNFIFKKIIICISQLENNQPTTTQQSK